MALRPHRNAKLQQKLHIAFIGTAFLAFHANIIANNFCG